MEQNPPHTTTASLTCSVLLTTAGTLSLHPQLRKDVSSSSAAQTECSPAATTPADAPRLTESAGEEGEGGVAEGKVEEEAPKGASLVQETSAKQEGVCG